MNHCIMVINIHDVNCVPYVGADVLTLLKIMKELKFK